MHAQKQSMDPKAIFFPMASGETREGLLEQLNTIIKDRNDNEGEIHFELVPLTLEDLTDDMCQNLMNIEYEALISHEHQEEAFEEVELKWYEIAMRLSLNKLNAR